MAYINLRKKELLGQHLRAYFLDCEAIHYNFSSLLVLKEK